MVTLPVANQTTGILRTLLARSRIVTPAGILIVVKLKTLSHAGLRPSADGSKSPETVGLYAPSLPVDPLENACAHAPAASASSPRLFRMCLIIFALLEMVMTIA